MTVVPIADHEPTTSHSGNDGRVAFGVGSHLSAGAIVAISAAIAIGAAVAGWRRLLQHAAAAGLIVGGAIANAADRMTAPGSVVDSLDIGRWPVFNLADVSLITGIGLLVLANSRSHRAGRAQYARILLEVDPGRLGDKSR